MRLRCVNIATTQMEAMKTFYSVILDAAPIERGKARAEISAENVCIVLTQTATKTPVNPDCCGLEFQVDDVDAAYERLMGAKIPPQKAPVTLPWNWRYFSVKDPDGNNVDFVQYVGE